MKKLLASFVSVVTVAAVTAPVMAEELSKKTELVDASGQSVDKMVLRYNFDAGWVIDNQNLLYRDTSLAHYLVTMKEPCKQLNVRSRDFKFFPSWSWQLLSTNTYEVKPERGQECAVAKIAQVDDATATKLRDAADRRIW